jgi:hypothetical protein
MSFRSLMVEQLALTQPVRVQFLPEAFLKEMARMDEKKLVCVLCGRPWHKFANRCRCGGFCTWGSTKGAEPDSWIRTEQGYVPRPVPQSETKQGEEHEDQ